MDKTLVGLIGAGLALAASPSNAAATPPPASVMQANSYADLLKPVPNATAVLEALYQQPPAPPEARDPEIQQVDHHHHHHHHHHRRYHHHHHRRYFPF